ncbi:SLC13 family permease [Fusobacterium mortiferum]|uniref:SLC13 family permease n=1 Tax=Fusobacterium mortiferum TaxID=850 RepID=UPI0025CE2F7A|nr:SLC13 family permease [uncultured Fusobacterium sp.]
MQLVSIASLIILVITIVIGFVKKINMGVLALGFSFILGYLGKISASSIIKGFNSSLFLMLVGVSILFGIAQHNGTLNLIVKKLIRLSGKRAWLIPILMYFVIYFIAFLGAGTITGFALAALFGIPMAKELDADPFLLTTMGQLGSIGGGIVPWAPTGIIGLELAKNANITGNLANTMVLNTFLATAFGAIISYIFLKGYKLKAKELNSEVLKFNKNQKITLVGILCMVIGVAVFKMNIGLLSIFISIILILLKVGTEKEALGSVPWNTILLISGMGILMSLIVKLGGIKLLADILSLFMNEKTVAGILALSSGILSLFSSTSGVVMPTMIPTIPLIVETLGIAGVVPSALLLSAVINGSSPSGMSPLSTGGAFVMATLSENYELTSEEFSSKFKRLFYITMLNMFMVAIFILIGGFSFTKYM